MIVLDTHVLIWSVQEDERLGKAARAMVDQAVQQRGAMVPAFCAWEAAMPDRAGRVPFVGGALQWMRHVPGMPGFVLVPLEPDIAVGSVSLAWEHEDPADRAIVATAQHLDCPLLTADRKILAYAAAGYLKAVDARA